MCSLFLAIGGLELRKLVHRLNLPDKKFQTLIDCVKKYLQPVKNVLLERHKFNCSREAGEEISQFIVRLRQQAFICDFDKADNDTIVNQMIRDQLIRGINNSKLTENILFHGAITLEETISKLDAFSQAIIDAGTLNENKKPVFHIDKFNKQSNRTRSSSRSRKEFKCYSCGKPGHFSNECKSKNNCITCGKLGHSSNQCYKNAKCKKCLKVGHTENVCRVNKTNMLLTLTNTKTELKYVDASLNKIQIKLLVDTGACFSVISNTFITDNNLQSRLKSCELNTVVADGRSVVIRHCIDFVLNVNGHSLSVCMYVLETNVTGIMGIEIIN